MFSDRFREIHILFLKVKVWLLTVPTAYDFRFGLGHRKLKVETHYVQSCVAFQCRASVIIAVLCSLSEQGRVQHDWAGDAMDSASMGRRRASTREFTLSISSSERERRYVTRTTSPNPGLMRYDISMCKYKACRTAADNTINSDLIAALRCHLKMFIVFVGYDGRQCFLWCFSFVHSY